MAWRALIATKLYAPKLRRGLQGRPRLLDRLVRGVESRLTLAGPFGQRALILLDVRRGRARQGGARDRLGVLELIASSPLPTDLVLTTLLNELAVAPGQVCLVLDDYHYVDNHEVRDGMTLLLEHLPAHVHVLLSTRADPDLPLARWRVRGELVEIRAADLRFTSDETAKYLSETTGLDLTAGDAQVLGDRTEGWIAALQLAALSIQGRDDGPSTSPSPSTSADDKAAAEQSAGAANKATAKAGTS